ncbi:hypothetical protein [Cobetia sp. QF-1]|uniref:hypothetical protein n=1 Tax=Cobetia sp. QF-1 TaxID=1969833 RepID=UPI001595E8CC|nr:hypothetical protein [Cobetia sp. QF-1]
MRISANEQLKKNQRKASKAGRTLQQWKQHRSLLKKRAAYEEAGQKNFQFEEPP